MFAFGNKPFPREPSENMSHSVPKKTSRKTKRMADPLGVPFLFKVFKRIS